MPERFAPAPGVANGARIRPARPRGFLGGAFPISTGRRPLFTASWKRLSGKILSRLTGPAPCWMTKPAPLARLGLPPATSFEPGGGFPPTVPFAGALSADSRRLALLRAGPFRHPRHNPGVRRRACSSAHGMSSSPVPARPRATGRALGAVRTGEPLRGIPAKDPSGSGYDGRQFRDADVCVVPFPTLRQRRRGQSGDATATAASTIRAASLAPHQNAGNGMRLASADGSREQRRTWKRPRGQVLL